MDAKLFRLAPIAGWLLFPTAVDAASYSSANFVVTAPTTEVATQVAQAAEFWRHELAEIWLGEGLPNWSRPCPISVKVGQIGAGGSTTFTFENGEVFGWNMKVQGTLERILDSVIPHEVNHTIFASYFRRPLPRWADEGAATIVEHESERARQIETLNQVMNTSRRIPLKQLLSIQEYPEEMEQVLTLYAEGYSLADFLIQSQGSEGRATYLKFLAAADKWGWQKAIERFYGYSQISDLEEKWTGWIMAGSPQLKIPEGTELAVAGDQGMRAGVHRGLPDDKDLVVRLQSPSEAQLQPELKPLPPIPRGLRQPARASTSIESSDNFAGMSLSAAAPETSDRSSGGRGIQTASALPEASSPTPANGPLPRRIQQLKWEEIDAMATSP